MKSKNPKVEALLNDSKTWKQERRKIRSIILDCGLTETVKWGKLCYTFEESNVVMFYGLKDYCAAGFLKGSLLSDPHGVLVQPGKNSQAARWMKFVSLAEIREMEPTLRAYLREAIEAEKAGLKVEFKEKHELVYANELQQRLAKDSRFKAAFEALTPGRQRGYNLHFSGAKQSKTRTARIEKAVPRILAGKGRNDR